MNSATYRANGAEPWEADADKYLFNGRVGAEDFRLFLKIEKPDSFLPLISGKIEPTSSGCILFLNYSLFPASVMFLAFWGAITFLAALFLVLQGSNLLYAAACLLAGVGNFLFAQYYFKTKIKHSQAIFHQMLSLQEKN